MTPHTCTDCDHKDDLISRLNRELIQTEERLEASRKYADSLPYPSDVWSAQSEADHYRETLISVYREANDAGSNIAYDRIRNIMRMINDAGVIVAVPDADASKPKETR